MAYPLFKLSDELESSFSSSLFSLSTLPVQNTKANDVIKSWTFDNILQAVLNASTNLTIGTLTGGYIDAASSLSSSTSITSDGLILGKTYPTFSTSGFASGTGTTASVAFPSTSAGQIIFVFVHKGNSSTFSTNAMSLIDQSIIVGTLSNIGTGMQTGANGDSGYIYWRIADGTEGGKSASIAWTGSTNWNASYAIYNAPNLVSPINAVTASTLTANTANTLPSVTSTVGYTEAIYVSMTYLSGTTEATTFAAGPTKRFDYASTTGNISIAIADKTNGTVGTASGTNSISTPDSATNLAWTIALAGISASPGLYSEASILNALSNLTADGTAITSSVESWGFLSIS